MNIIVLTRHPARASTARLRGYAFQSAFAVVGDVVFNPLFSDQHVVRLGKRRTIVMRVINYSSIIYSLLKRVFFMLTLRLRYDTPYMIIIMQEPLPFVPTVLEQLIIKLSNASRIVTDLDDAYYEVYREMKPVYIANLFKNKLERIWSSSDLVLSGSPVLTEEVQSYVTGKTRIVDFPTVVDAARYIPRDYSGSECTVGEVGEKLVIGWIGSPSTVTYLNDLIHVLERANESISLKLVVVGALNVKSESILVECHHWSLDAEIKYAKSFDIGVMPLIDSKYTRGKCGYKLIQYMASAVPVIASDVGVNRHIVEGGPDHCGFTVNSDEQWVEAIIKLGQSKELRQAMGVAGRARVLETYCIDAVAPILIKELNCLT